MSTDKNLGGAPIGNKNATKNRVWTLAIQKAVAGRSSKADKLSALVELADKLLDKCAEGDMTALKELGDRLEGRPVQAIANPDGSNLQITKVERVIISERPVIDGEAEIVEDARLE